MRPRPVTPQLFSEHVEGVDPPAAEALCNALKAAGLLNATDFLKEDPRCGSAPQTRADTCRGVAVPVHTRWSPTHLACRRPT